MQRFRSRSWNSRSRTACLHSWCAFDRLIIWQTLTEHLPWAMHYDTVPSPNPRPVRLVGIFKEPLPVLSTHRQRPEVLGNLSCWNRFCAHSEGRVSAGNQRDFSCERIQFRKKQALSSKGSPSGCVREQQQGRLLHVGARPKQREKGKSKQTKPEKESILENTFFVEQI